MFVWQLANQVYPSTWAFFTKLQLGWSSGEIGGSLAFVGVTMAVVQGYLTGRFVHRLGERRVMFTGLAAGVGGFAALAFATRGWMVYAILVPSALQGLAYPAMKAVLSQRVPADAQGELQGGLASLLSLSTILGPFLMTQVLRLFSRPEAPVHFPGAAFLLAAVLGLATLALLALGLRHGRAAQPAPPAAPA